MQELIVITSNKHTGQTEDHTEVPQMKTMKTLKRACGPTGSSYLTAGRYNFGSQWVSFYVDHLDHVCDPTGQRVGTFSVEDRHTDIHYRLGSREQRPGRSLSACC